MENQELSLADWLNKAEHYCALAEHCASDVRRKLIQWNAPEELFDEIVQNLYQNHYLDDVRYCRAYAHDKLEYQHWGRLKIRAGLNALRLPNSAIEETLDSIDESRYMAILREVIRKSGKGKLIRGENNEKLIRFLLQRGFSYEEIKKCY